VVGVDGKIVCADPAARAFLDLKRGVGSLQDEALAAEAWSSEILALVRHSLRHRSVQETEISAASDARLSAHVTPIDASERSEALVVLVSQHRDREARGRCMSFLAEVAHDLRSPLTVMQGHLEVLAAGRVSAAVRREYLGVALGQIGLMSDMLRYLLDASAIFAGRLEPTRQAVNLLDVVSGVIYDLSREAALSSVTMALDAPDGLPPVFADPVAIRRVVTNLATNAIKYAGEPGTVRFSLGVEGMDVVLRVEDNGPGIMEEELQKIWTPFHTVQSELSARRRGGTGLGLAIVHGLVSAMAGRCGADSVVGQGSCFWVALPVADAARLDTERPAI